MNKRTFVIGDIHGGYKALQQVLQRAQLTTSDQLIFLGDYVDGWSESDKVIDLLIHLDQVYSCIFIRGNHDSLLQDWIENKTRNARWLRAGGQSTVSVYQKLPSSTIQEHLKFLKALRNYYIDDQERLFMHAGFSKLSGPKNEYFDFVFYWDRTLWETALATDKRLKPNHLYYPKRFKHFKEMFIGHTPVTELGTSQPVKALNLWNIDTGAGFEGPLTMMEINSKEVFQSDPVYTLYPKEKGRGK